MAQEETPLELSSDEQFDAVLDISVELLNSGHFEVRPSFGGIISITVKDENLVQAAAQRELPVETYNGILGHELDVLLTASVLDISEKSLFSSSPLKGADGEQRDIILGRWERVRARFPIARFAAEARAKRKCVTPTLDSMDWQVVSGREDAAPMVLVSIASSSQRRIMAAEPDTAVLLGLLTPQERAVVGCSLSDVEYLLRELEAVKAKLEAEEVESDGTD